MCSSTSVSSAAAVMENIDLMTVPLKALNISSRTALSWFLNPEQPLRSSKGLVRDYRGLAEQMGFEYNDIKNFRRNEDPTLKALEAWEGKPDNSIGLLMEYLENMDRHDVLEDLELEFKKDAEKYLKKVNKYSGGPVQVPEVTPGPSADVLQAENPNALTIGDIESGGCTYYDAYVCYAKEDLGFVLELAHRLESPEVGLKLFIKDRDLLLGTSEVESHPQLIHERCNRMIIILSPDFLKSPECEFQASFAAGLAVEQQKRKLIPILISPCEVPLILKFISKIDFTKGVIPSFLWERLVRSVGGSASASIFVSHSTVASVSRPALGTSQPQAGITFPSGPVITYPPSEVHINSTSTQANEQWASFQVSETSREQAQERVTVSSSGKQKTSHSKQKWINRLTGRFMPNPQTSSSNINSAATSGYGSNSSLTIDENHEGCVLQLSGGDVSS